MASLQPILVKNLSSTILRQIGAVLSRAFMNDPMYLYLQPDPARRAAFSPGWMTTLARYGMRYAQLHVTPDPIRGISIWMPPGAAEPGAFEMIRCGILGSLAGIVWHSLVQMLPLTRQWEALRRQQPPHWYLWLLGVDPDSQGQGIGSALMQPGLQSADRDRLPCYLETMTERDVAFYQKRGFEIVFEGCIPSGAPFWTMKRLVTNL